ncbi:unnamed protein product [Zymoseptoria tritici ST99CH_3D1]|nr:unnamed protein product [Zymoseptoria tritici ST99CH_3D1]
MSGQGGYYQQGYQEEALPSTNPWAEETGSNQHPSQQQFPHQQQYQQYQPPQGPPPQQQQQQQSGWQPQEHSYDPPSSGYQPPPGLPPRRTDTFQEENIVPPSERGEQREAMETFEMNRSKPENETDKNVAKLQEEFPSVDGALIAALYGDSQSLSGTREMLQELSAS